VLVGGGTDAAMNEQAQLIHTTGFPADGALVVIISSRTDSYAMYADEERRPLSGTNRCACRPSIDRPPAPVAPPA